MRVWPGDERSQQLADLTAAAGARAYLCGTGGMKYLDEAPFAAQSITVVPFRAPTTGMCSSGCQVSALWTLATRGPAAPADRLRILAGARTAMEGAA
ncbi:WbqC family protein [Streptomyces sp. NBC_00424]|uniref:WbqC family protein n=1 Tax=Streptomyces sp. NBC_00424 TaxID=2903648 RepID=UPI002B1D11D4|nr:WbqC family protein [Streptomyces sp. NBC_00424]